jgi:hypothetical protein
MHDIARARDQLKGDLDELLQSRILLADFGLGPADR